MERICITLCFRAVGRSENPGVPVSFGGHNLPPLVEIGLTDLQKSGGASTPRDDRPTTYLLYILPSRKLAISFDSKMGI